MEISKKLLSELVETTLDYFQDYGLLGYRGEDSLCYKACLLYEELGGTDEEYLEIVGKVKKDKAWREGIEKETVKVKDKTLADLIEAHKLMASKDAAETFGSHFAEWSSCTPLKEEPPEEGTNACVCPKCGASRYDVLGGTSTCLGYAPFTVKDGETIRNEDPNYHSTDLLCRECGYHWSTPAARAKKK